MADKYDKLLKEGLTRLKEAEFRYVPDEDDIEYEFSGKYLKAKERLLKKLDRSYWKYVNTAAKKAAVILITLIIAFSSLMTVDAFRETFVNFIITIYKNFTQIEEDLKTEEHIKTYYSFEKLPKSYTKVDVQYNKATYFQIWDNNALKPISLNQVPTHTSNQFDSEHGELSEAIINDTPCLICKDEIQYYCYWEFDGYRFELIYPADLGEEFMSEVVGNLVEIDPEEMQD